MYTAHDLPLEDINFKTVKTKKRRYNGEVCDNIIVADTEVTSYFITGMNKPVPFDYKNPQMVEEYTDKRGRTRRIPMRKGSLLYHWQVMIEGNYFTGRTCAEFRQFVIDINKYCSELKICFIHNLSYEFGVLLLNIADDWEVFARDAHRPMYVRSNKLNFEFRCSQFLTQLSLAAWGEMLGIDKGKDFDYNKIRTPLTKLNTEEQFYCRRDVEIMDKGIREYYKKYGAIFKIPLTQTGEVRLQCREIFDHISSFYDICWKLQPKNLKDSQWMLRAFTGGCVLANPVHKDLTIRGNLLFKDIASSYPWAMISERYPLEPYTIVHRPELYESKMNDPDLGYLVEFEAYDVQTKVPLLFLSSQKIGFKSKEIQQARKENRLTLINGRVHSADYIHCILYKTDFELFKKCYKFKELKINKLKVSKLDYLPVEFCKFIVECYKNKTELKGMNPEVYQKAKIVINGMFGLQCQKSIEDDLIFDLFHTDERGNPKEWYTEKLTAATYKSKLDDLLYYTDKKGHKRKKKIYTATQIGVAITAYARKNLWFCCLNECVNGEFLTVDDVIYTDTDSIKMFDSQEARDCFERYNTWVLDMHKFIAWRLGIPVTDLSPINPKTGQPAPIGCFAPDGEATEFKTLGAKKYIYRDKKSGKLKLTVAGVPKSGVICLNDDIENFQDGFTFSASKMHEEQTKEKAIPYYLRDMESIIFPDGYTTTDKFGICLVPADYKLSGSDDDHISYEEFMRILRRNAKRTLLLDPIT